MKHNNMNDTVTAKHIRTLRDEAEEAEDIAQVVLCRVALGEEDYSDQRANEPEGLDGEGLPDYSGGGWSDYELRKVSEALRMTADEAWAECERVIREARAEGEGCRVCGVEAEVRVCADCGMTAAVIDCGHYAQPAEIAASAHVPHDLVCEGCEEAREHPAEEAEGES